MSFPAAHDCCSELFSILACPFPTTVTESQTRRLLHPHCPLILPPSLKDPHPHLGPLMLGVSADIRVSTTLTLRQG